MNIPGLKDVTPKRLMSDLVCDCVASFLLGVSVTVFAINANFTPGGVSGLAVLLNYLLKTPIGLMTVLINIPIVVLTFKRLGLRFFLASAKTTLIGALFVDYITCLIPMYTGPRALAAVFAGVCAGIGYSFIFNADSSTGGTDFIIVAVKRVKPKLSFGMLAFVIDSSVIVLSTFVYKDVWSFVYGMVYTLVTSLSMDLTTAVVKRVVKSYRALRSDDRAADRPRG